MRRRACKGSSGINGRCWREPGRILPRRGHSWDVWVGYLAGFGRRYGCILLSFCERWAKGVDQEMGQRKGKNWVHKRDTQKRRCCKTRGKGIHKLKHSVRRWIHWHVCIWYSHHRLSGQLSFLILFTLQNPPYALLTATPASSTDNSHPHRPPSRR